jgi:prephenate dehydrogenase
VLAHAQSGGAIDRAASSLADIGAVDLIILAAPVRQNVALLSDVVSRLSRTPERATLITDVGGTKRDIVAAASSLPGHVGFIGGHPLSGAERGGFGFARPDLFKGRPGILTPGQDVRAPDLARLTGFVESFGARVQQMTPEVHDRLMAAVSHVPQLAASALMQVVGAAAGADGLKLAGRGLVDTTRLASSPASVWQDICGVNADAIGPTLDALIERLTDIRRSLGRGEIVASTFEEAARWRSELMAGRE